MTIRLMRTCASTHQNVSTQVLALHVCESVQSSQKCLANVGKSVESTNEGYRHIGKFGECPKYMSRRVLTKVQTSLHDKVCCFMNKKHNLQHITAQLTLAKPARYAKLAKSLDLLDYQFFDILAKLDSSEYLFFDIPYILAYKSRNFGQNIVSKLPIRLIHRSQKCTINGNDLLSPASPSHSIVVGRSGGGGGGHSGDVFKIWCKTQFSKI